MNDINISENWKKVREQVARAALRSGRNPEDVQIIAVSKLISIDRMQAAIDAGVNVIGENRVQEAWKKYQQLGNRVSWHLVGHLQTNKVKRALQMFDVIHSVDSPRLAHEINRRCDQLERNIDVLVEVKTSGESSKYGIEPEKTLELVEKIADMPHLNLIGLMTIGKWTVVEAEVRQCFRLLYELREKINSSKIPGISLSHLSMGMSGDFEWAIEEGATIVRIGTSIFGPREEK